MIEHVTILLRTTAFRLASIYLAAFVIAGAVAVVLLLRQTSSLLTDEPLRQIGSDRAVLMQTALTRGPSELISAIEQRAASGGTGLYILSDGDGGKRAGNLGAVPPELRANPSGGTFHVMTGGGQRLAAGMLIAVPGGGELVIGRDIEEARAIAERMRRMFLIGIAMLVLAGLAGGILASWHLLRRIDAITATSRSIMAGELTKRVPLAGSGDELDGLAHSLNAMLDRIEQLMAGMREVSDNIAHDLKTPLNRMRNRIEAALKVNASPDTYRAGLQQALEEADEIIKTFNALLLIARLEAGAVEESKAEIDLSALIDDVVDLYAPVAEEAGLAIGVRCEPSIHIHGNRHLIGQAVANLVDNAIKYAVTGEMARKGAGRIEVSLRADGDGAAISVADNGPGIPAADRERALKRFVRLDASRSTPGTGLGLSLVAAVARLHGGSLGLEDNAPGLRVVMRLPVRLPSGTEGRTHDEQ